MHECTDTAINPLCKEKFENIEEGVAKILSNQDEFHNKMFVDNGNKSFQSFRRSAEVFMKIHMWVYGVIFSGIILTTVGGLVKQAMK